MELHLPKSGHSSSRALVGVVALSGVKATISTSESKEPSLKANGSDVTGPVAIARAIIATGKNPSLAGPQDQQESVTSWVAFAASLPTEAAAADAQLKKLDDSLRPATFLVGSAPSIADLFVYSGVFPLLEALNNVQRFGYANVTRWFDHVQHLPAFNSHRDRLSLIPIKRNVAALLTEKAALEKGKPAERQHKGEAHKEEAHKEAAEAKPKAAKKEPTTAATPAAAAPAEAKGDNKKKEKAAAKPTGEPKAAKGKGGKNEAPAQSDISKLEIKVGKIIEVKQHTENLYVEKIDLGEAAPRTIVSGLVKFVPIDQMQNRLVLVLANLAPRALQGITSEGMVLCASSDDHNTVQMLDPPAGTPLGERVSFAGETGEPERPALNRKVLERVFVDLKTNDNAVATYKGVAFTTTKGEVKVASLKNAHIK